MTQNRSPFTKIALVAVLVTGLSSLVAPAVSASTLTPRARMYHATNNSRLNNGVHRVDIHWTMSRLARRHSIAMANKGYIFHTANPSAFYLDGVNWSTWGENVGATTSTISSIQNAFMQSSGHRANILNQRFRRVAVGTYRDDTGMLWVTVFFYG
jgi:uncharacterized protein YkwD